MYLLFLIYTEIVWLFIVHHFVLLYDDFVWLMIIEKV